MEAIPAQHHQANAWASVITPHPARERCSGPIIPVRSGQKRIKKKGERRSELSPPSGCIYKAQYAIKRVRGDTPFAELLD
jgi:hypothetical protein